MVVHASGTRTSIRNQTPKNHVLVRKYSVNSTVVQDFISGGDSWWRFVTPNLYGRLDAAVSTYYLFLCEGLRELPPILVDRSVGR